METRLKNNAYEPLSIEVLEINVEQGFATSSTFNEGLTEDSEVVW